MGGRAKKRLPPRGFVPYPAFQGSHPIPDVWGLQMFRFARLGPLVPITLLLCLVFAACDSDDTGSPPAVTTGEIAIDAAPDSLDAPWRLGGAAAAAGSGDTLLADMTAGDYTLTWDPVEGWIEPAAQSLSLAAGDTIFFAGVYTASVTPTGTIVIDPGPDDLDAPWTLAGPAPRSGSGDATLEDLPTGVYTLTWGDVDGWITPDPDTRALAADATLSFTGAYIEDIPETGTIVIAPEPAILDAPWILTGPRGETGAGAATLEEMPVGEYRLLWGLVEDWIRPFSSPRTLAADGTLTFAGVYVMHPSVAAAFVPVPAGVFMMGSPTNESGRQFIEARHEVTLTTPFEIFATEVTNEQFAELGTWALDRGYITLDGSVWRDALDGSTAALLDMSAFTCPISHEFAAFNVEAGMEHLPVIVNWYGAAAYCDWLSLREGLSRAYDHATWSCNGDAPYGAGGYRLPTEAEWEYACRAGSVSAFANGPISDLMCDDPVLEKIGWYCGNAAGVIHKVGELDPNDWDLYDMHGNLYEWCNDAYDLYPAGPATDPVGPVGPNDRVIRSGSWGNSAALCRSAFRNHWGPSLTDDAIGFRPARSVPSR